MVTSTIPGFSFPFGLTDTTSQYDFAGFLPPVGAQPTVNQANAGQAIPLKFSLSGDQGLNIFNTGSPTVQQVVVRDRLLAGSGVGGYSKRATSSGGSVRDSTSQ